MNSLYPFQLTPLTYSSLHQLSHPPTLGQRLIGQFWLIPQTNRDYNHRRRLQNISNFSRWSSSRSVCDIGCETAPNCLSILIQIVLEWEMRERLEMRKFVCIAALEKMCTRHNKNIIKCFKKKSFTISFPNTQFFSRPLQLCCAVAVVSFTSFFLFYVKRKQTTTKRKAHARDRELEIISKAWHTRPVCCLCLREWVHANFFPIVFFLRFSVFILFSWILFSIIHVTMCGTHDDALKTRSHELILFNVTYENIKISYSFMVNLSDIIEWLKVF